MESALASARYSNRLAPSPSAGRAGEGEIRVSAAASEFIRPERFLERIDDIIARQFHAFLKLLFIGS